MKIIIKDYYHNEVVVMDFKQSIQDAEDVLEEISETATDLGYTAQLDTDEDGDECIMLTEVNIDNTDDEHIKDLRDLASWIVKGYLP